MEIDLDDYWVGRNPAARQLEWFLLLRPLSETTTADLARMAARGVDFVVMDLSRSRDPLLMRDGRGE